MQVNAEYQRKCSYCGKERLCEMCIFAILHIPLSQILSKHARRFKIRPNSIQSYMAKTTSLSDILSDPTGTRDQLRFSPKIGQVSILRITQAINHELKELFPNEFQAASNSLGSLQGSSFEQVSGDQSLTEKLRRFNETWVYPDEDVTFFGKFYTPEATKGKGSLSGYRNTSDITVYVADNLPEEIKTSAVMSAETGCTDRRHTSTFKQFTTLDAILGTHPHSRLLLDMHTLADLHFCRGRYANLYPEDASEQLERIYELKGSDVPSRIFVADLRKNFAVPGMAGEKGPLFQRFSNGHIEISSMKIVAHFLHVARAALGSGMEYGEWLTMQKMQTQNSH